MPSDFVHRWIEGKPGSPVLLLLHGTGGDENDLLPIGGALLPGAALLSPRGQVLENGMPRFFRRLAEGVFDEDDVRRRAHELAEFVASAAQRYGFDASAVTAVGYSNGANIAAAMLLLRPETLRAAVLLRPMVPLEPDPLPVLRGRHVLISAGEQDPLASPDDAQRLAALLARAGATVKLQWSPGGHGLLPQDFEYARTWLAEVRE